MCYIKKELKALLPILKLLGIMRRARLRRETTTTFTDHIRKGLGYCRTITAQENRLAVPGLPDPKPTLIGL
jgi:hypothetical protein